MSSHRRRYSKREPLGSLHVDYVMSVSDLGLVLGSNRWEVLLRHTSGSVAQFRRTTR